MYWGDSKGVIFGQLLIIMKHSTFNIKLATKLVQNHQSSELENSGILYINLPGYNEFIIDSLSC